MSALRATGTLIAIQVLSRLSTFVINQASLRYLSPTLLGASTQLELLNTTILTFARDSLRVALAREGYDPNLQGVVNAAHLPVLLGVPLSLGFKWLYEYSGLPAVNGMQQAVNWVCGAAVLEMAAEPAFALVQVKGQYGVRGQAETLGTVARCIVTFASVVVADWTGKEPGVLPFAYGQMGYAVVLLLVYLVRIPPVIREAKVSWLPKQVAPQASSPAAGTSDGGKESPRVTDAPQQDSSLTASADSYLLNFVSRNLLYLGLTVSSQTIIKQILGEGDHIILARYASLAAQGSYDLAHNYGSLIARVALQPIEEGCRGLFGRLCAGAEQDADVVVEDEKKREKGKASEVDEKEELAAKKGMETNLRQARSTLMLVLKVYSLFSVWLLAVGPPLAPLALRLIAGAKWASGPSGHSHGHSNSADSNSSSAGDTLATYLYLLPCLAYNGILEAFVAAVAPPSQLHWQSVLFSVFAAMFMIAGYVLLGLLKWGAEGLILAQGIAMGARILWSYRWTGHWFGAKDLALGIEGLLPSGGTVAVAAIAAASMRTNFLELSGWVDSPIVGEILVKGPVAGATTLGMAYTERAFWLEQWELLAPTIEGGAIAASSSKKN
ncbi:MAG: hypothetical protein Q9162_006124 [Coniocarpon cinnabarinum]